MWRLSSTELAPAIPTMVVLCVVSSGFAAIASGNNAPPSEKPSPTATTTANSNNDRINATPDVMQSAKTLRLPGGGLTYCGPIAVMNSFTWLSQHGYPNLAPQNAGKTNPQGQYALDLGHYLGVTKDVGTTPSNMLTGLECYVRDHGYKIKAIKYQGWEGHPKRFSTGVDTPNLTWIKDGFNDKSAVFLMIGWYKVNKAAQRYTEFAQHWVTVVGYEKNPDGSLDERRPIIHDSAPRSGVAVSHDTIKATRINGGAFGGGRDFGSANGSYKLTGGLKIKAGADCGILDGAVIMTLE